MKVEEFEKWLREHTILSEGSIRQYVSQVRCHKFDIDEAITNESPEEINRILVSEYRDKNSSTKKPAFIYYLKARNKAAYILELTRLRTKPRKLMPSWLSPQEIEVLLYCLKPSTRLILELQYSTGTRVREILTLKREHIQERAEGPAIMILAKGGRTRIRGITQEQYSQLQRLMPKHESFIFLSPPIKKDVSFEGLIRSNYNRIEEEIKLISEKNLGKQVRSHDIRRSLAENTLKAKGRSIDGIKEAQKILGHSRIDTTFKYLAAFGSLD